MSSKLPLGRIIIGMRCWGVVRHGDMDDASTTTPLATLGLYSSSKNRGNGLAKNTIASALPISLRRAAAIPQKDYVKQ
jgi:hypothetical protein